MKILFVLMMLATSLLAEEWCVVNSSGIVTRVIVAEQAHINTRTDGPWIKVPYKVGQGWKKTGNDFSLEKSTFVYIDTSQMMQTEWTTY